MSKLCSVQQCYVIEVFFTKYRLLFYQKIYLDRDSLAVLIWIINNLSLKCSHHIVLNFQRKKADDTER